MKVLLIFLTVLIFSGVAAQTGDADRILRDLKDRFMDAYWKQYPAYSIYVGYGKYYEDLAIPSERYFRSCVAFSNAWLDSLKKFNYDKLTANNKISHDILKNQLRSDIWGIDVFKIQQWDPSIYNLGNECYMLLTEPYASLDTRLKTLSRRLQFADVYYKGALNMLLRPTREHARLSIQQNEGALEIFNAMLPDSIKSSRLNASEKDTLQQRIKLTVDAIKGYVAALKKISADSNYSFRSFRIGKELFNQKFKNDIVSDYTADEIFKKANEAKKYYHREMYQFANKLWTKYCGNAAKPSDSLLLIKAVIDSISLNHVSPKDFFDTLNKQVKDLKRFVVEKDLFDFDTSATLIVRKMPAFASGVSTASANFPLPYQKSSVPYYNVADLTVIPTAKAESRLREYNNYILQILTIHEAVPGHCMQGIYNSKSTDIIKAVFGNGAMSEGWAVYCQRMMLENGWGDNSPEIWLMFYKWSLRECCNVIVDYGIHCLDYSKENIVKLLKYEAFQQDDQVEEKYNRATLSQVQLCSYFTGATEIFALREAYKIKAGTKYSLKEFHEKFLSFGTAPVKFIRQLMLK
jgi:uncharacterized protein (DUF885 family)